MATTVNAGTIVLIAKDSLDAVVAHGLVQPDGSFSVKDVQTVLAAVAEVEGSLKAHGVVLPAKVDEVIAALPLILKLFGL